MQSSKNILVIEDDKPIREMLKAVLEIEGYAVKTVENGFEGIEAIVSHTLPDAILLDMMMPVMNGWDFMDFLRTNAFHYKIPVIIISAYSETAKTIKPEAIINKPIQLKELLGALEKLVS
jgi:CheY-like chemotaxis protein